ncbi:hypothetical protein PYW08_012110 [Mythimna loreyi]|uniref:Uncharacterized protein n=1 Tax=Mythimna loreyi TaxID=667449 RepID=A0ACC2Q1M7_9NEOP|nr:hypothetical protein PYW08_012110 [Mythimna loreyi]
MDDDIDIEEHDVLDNPRIKSIFPDLSRVKIEVPDDEDLVEDQYGILEPAEEPQEMQYQYEYSFETAPDDMQEDYVQEGTPEDMEEDQEGEDNSYFYDNQIILGSKPSPDLELLYEEALTSQPIVYLENWQDRLKSSPCFCDTCEILFPTVNALDAHKMISHSYLVAMEIPHKNTARKSTATSKYCNHCSKTFPDDTSLIKHLYELLPLNNFSKVKEEKVEPEKKFKTPVPWPKKIKIEPREVKVEPVEEAKPKLKTLQRDGKFFAASTLVPKSTLFLCNGCQVGFLSCFGAAQHAKMCRKLTTFDRCGICKRKIRTRDVKTHELQHSFSDKLKIYTMNKSIYERVLCKCPKCLSCFDELAFWAHYPKCKKSDKKSMYCTDCDVNIALSRYKWHRLRHSTKKLTKKDFIVVEFYDQYDIKNEENKLELLRIQKKERQKMYKATYRRKQQGLIDAKPSDGDIKVYYCEDCGCCQCRLNYKGHTDGLCKRTLAKKYCEKCGLCFTSKSIESHQNLHDKRSFSLKDISIISLTTGNPLEPQIPDFYQCHKCSKNFLYRRTLFRHDCKTEKHITCKLCSKKYNIQAYKIHKIFHAADKLMPALMKQYSLINDMWNVMYMCVSCDLVTMTYDSAVTHSQGHLNYIISDLHRQCVVCDLRIAEKEFTLHEKLHSNNDCIGRESFKILQYKFEDLFKKEWLLLFKDLPREHRQQILSKSIYRFTRSVKMQIEINASTNETKYFCMNCNTFVEGPFVKRHIKSKRSKRKIENSVETSPVKKPRTSLRDLDTPLSERKSSRRALNKASTSRDSGMDFDDSTNEIIVPDEISIHANVNNDTNIDNDTSELPGLDKNGLSSRLKSRIIVKGYGKELYKCLHCDAHYMKKESFVYHVNRNPGPHDFTDKHECDICGIIFSKHTLPRHKYVHHDKMGLKRHDFVILTDYSTKQENLQEIKVENASEILDISTEVNDDTISVNDSINDTKILSELNNSDNRDSENLSDVNINDICDTNSENISVNDTNVNVKVSNTEIHSDVKVSETEILSDVKVGDTEILSDVKIR